MIDDRFPLFPRLPTDRWRRRGRNEELLVRSRRLQTAVFDRCYRLSEIAGDDRFVDFVLVQLYASTGRCQGGFEVHPQPTEAPQPLESDFRVEISKEILHFFFEI